MISKDKISFNQVKHAKNPKLGNIYPLMHDKPQKRDFFSNLQYYLASKTRKLIPPMDLGRQSLFQYI